MTSFSIAAQVESWVDATIAAETTVSGDEYGRHVQMAAVQTPQGDAIVWLILLTTRSPLLGQPPLGATIKLPGNVPSEAEVGREVRDAIAALRKDFDARKRPEAATNGHGPALPPGLKGLKL